MKEENNKGKGGKRQEKGKAARESYWLALHRRLGDKLTLGRLLLSSYSPYFRGRISFACIALRWVQYWHFLL